MPCRALPKSAVGTIWSCFFPTYIQLYPNLCTSTCLYIYLDISKHLSRYVRPRIYGPKYIYPNTYLDMSSHVYMGPSTYIQTPIHVYIDMSTEQLLEDRRNGMGLQKAAKKYGMGVARIRKIEAENGMGKELVPAEPFPSIEEIYKRISKEETPISPEDIRKHFQEVQDSFAIALEEIQKTKEELGEKIEQLWREWKAEDMESELEELDMEDELEELGEKNRHPNRPAVGVYGCGCVGIWLLSIQFPTPTQSRNTLCACVGTHRYTKDSYQV